MIERELETEYKAMLTKEQFESLKAYFATFTTVVQPYKQTNYYFDIVGDPFIRNSTTIRIRYKDDSYTLQVKIPKINEDGYIQQEEYKQLLKMDEAIRYIEGGIPLKLPLIKEALKQSNAKINQLIDDSELKELLMLGSLTTERHDFLFYTDIISLDKSTYLDFTDYELEWETSNRPFVKMELGRLNIIPKVEGKIERFIRRLKKK